MTTPRNLTSPPTLARAPHRAPRATAARWHRAARRAGDMRPADAFARPRPELGVLLAAFGVWARAQLAAGRLTAQRGRHA